MQQHDDPQRFREMGIDLFSGKGQFMDAHTVTVNGDQVLTGGKIILATGSKPLIPNIQGLRDRICNK